ncbi:DUF2283 domain-containing protein [Candidatus Woesearchaeota archaeon]|nr:DUF2283 domain-containing protein [Candidatus Woesearchaeota archaeon]
MQKDKFSYDPDNDDLLVYKAGAKSSGSVALGDIILDYDSKKELVGLQLRNASKIIRDFVNKSHEEVESVLAHLESCKLDVKAKNNLVIIRLTLIGLKNELSPVFSVPRIEESSPALAYA